MKGLGSWHKHGLEKWLENRNPEMGSQGDHTTWIWKYTVCLANDLDFILWSMGQGVGEGPLKVFR